MDVSAVKYNKQLNAFASPKLSVQNTGDVFLSLLDNFRTSGSAEESSERVLSRITKHANTAAVFKDTGKKTVAEAPAPKETPKTQYVEADAPSEAPKTDDADGQKIPAEENTSRPADEKTQTDAERADGVRETSEAADKPENSEQTHKKDGAASESESAGDAALAALNVSAASAPAAAQAVSETVKTDDASLARPTENEDGAVETQSQSGRPSQTANGAEDVPETAAGENAKAVGNATEEQPQTATAAKEFDALVKTAPAATQTKAQAADVPSVRNEAASPETATTEDAPKRANAEADAQAEELSKALPAGNKVKVETTDMRAAANAAPAEKAALNAKTADEGEVRTDQPKSFSDAKTLGDAAVKSVENNERGYEQGRSDAQARQQPQQQTASLTPNAAGAAAVGGQAAQSAEFQSVLKGGQEGVSGVTGTAGSQTAGEAGQLPFNVQNGALKGKAVAGTATAPKTVPTNELVDQIKVSISKAAKEGLEKININLKPKELGNIQVRLEVDGDGNMKASIIASRPETLDLLQRDASALRQALADAGLKTGDNAFSFSYRGEQQQNAEAFTRNGNGHHGGSEAGFNDPETPNGEADDLTEAIIASGWTSRHALNIRV